MINQLSNDKLSKMKQFIDHELENIRRTYIQTPARIVSDYNNEVEKIKDYNGRQLLEMLQNADDESENALDKTAYTLNCTPIVRHHRYYLGLLKFRRFFCLDKENAYSLSK